MSTNEKRGSDRSGSFPVVAALTLGLAAFFLLSGYECARSASVSLYLEVYGAHRLPVVLALGPIGTLILLYGYGWLLSRVGAERTLLLTLSLIWFGNIALLLSYNLQ